jgi:hypothetical protein
MMATAYGIAERAADQIKATYGAVIPIANGSTSDSGSSSGSSSSNTATHKSTLSTGTKAAIGAASGVAAIALIAVRSNHPHVPALTCIDFYRYSFLCAIAMKSSGAHHFHTQ